MVKFSPNFLNWISPCEFSTSQFFKLDRLIANEKRFTFRNRLSLHKQWINLLPNFIYSLYGSSTLMASSPFPQMLKPEWKWMAVANTQACYDTVTITAAISFVAQVPVTYLRKYWRNLRIKTIYTIGSGQWEWNGAYVCRRLPGAAPGHRPASPWGRPRWSRLCTWPARWCSSCAATLKWGKTLIGWFKSSI